MSERDELIGLLAGSYRRATIRYFHESREDVASVSDVAEAIGESHQQDPQQVAARLHHSALPKLAESDVVEYDHRSTSVRYCGNPCLYAMFDALDDL